MRDAIEHAAEALQGIKELVEKYHFEGMIVTPLGLEPITVRELMLSWDGFEKMTIEMQDVILAEAMEFCDILDIWVTHMQNKTDIALLRNTDKNKAGDTITVSKDTAKMAVECGLAMYAESVIK